MRSLFVSLFGALLSWWGVWLIAALDSSMVFFLPLAVDIAVIVLASRSPSLFWLYPILASAGSLCGAAVTYYVGRRVGEAGIHRLISSRRVRSVQRRIETKGALALAFLDLVPPPFPFTAIILGAGAFEVNPFRFFLALGLARLLRFGLEATLAFFYGPQIVRWFNSDAFQYAGIFLTVLFVFGTALAVLNLVRMSRPRRRRNGRTAA
jgi:membrane protein YqaA with SNARE-associated domain